AGRCARPAPRPLPGRTLADQLPGTAGGGNGLRRMARGAGNRAHSPERGHAGAASPACLGLDRGSPTSGDRTSIRSRIITSGGPCGSGPWPDPPPGTEGAQRAGELQAALDHLRGVRDSYWDYGWRGANRGGGRYPENKLWEAVQRAIWIFSTPANRLMTRHWRGPR